MILSIAFPDIINIYANLLPNSISGQGVCCKLRRQLGFYTRCDTMCSPLNHNRNPKPSDQQPEWVLHRGMQDWFVCGTWALQGWTSNASAGSQTSWSGWQSIASGYGSRRMFMDSDVICSLIRRNACRRACSLSHRCRMFLWPLMTDLILLLSPMLSPVISGAILIAKGSASGWMMQILPSS